MARAGGRRVAVLGPRLSALLAAELAQRSAAERLVLWQPVVNGEAFMTQVLRLRLAGDLAQGDGERTSTKDVRARLGAGEVLELAGYPFAPELVAGEPFWTLQETTVAPAVVAATVARLTGGTP